jgi:hypothetical protein
LNINDILSHITGSFLITNPSIIFNYSNSFPDLMTINLNAAGKRKDQTVNLNLAPFSLTRPNVPAQQEITTSYTIDKTNSNLQNLISLPPEVIDFSGSATLTISAKSSQIDDYALSSNHLLGSLEIDVPLELTINNLQFTDTVDNFLEDKSNGNDSPVKPEDFQFLRVNIAAKNGFPLGVSLKMSLYDSGTNTIKSTVDATGILESATVDSNGKATGVTESSTSIEFTNEFFGSVNKADKIIFRFTLNSTGNGDVKIYSDYRINFTAALVVKPDINLH